MSGNEYTGPFSKEKLAQYKARSKRNELVKGIQAFGDINNIFHLSPREQGDFVLLRDMIVHDAKALIGLRLAVENPNATNDEIALAFAEGSSFGSLEQFEIGHGIAQNLHKELAELRKKTGSTAAATERADQILTEYEIDKKIDPAERTHLKKMTRALLLREFTAAEVQQMRDYLNTENRPEPANDVQQYANMALHLAEHRLKQGGMQAINDLCTTTSETGGVQPGIIDLYDDMMATPSLIKAMYKAHDTNKEILAKCNEALPILKQAAESMAKHFPDKDIAAAYVVPNSKKFRAAEDAIESMPGREPVKGVIERIRNINEEAYLGSDDKINVEIGARIDGAQGLERSISQITYVYTEGGASLGKTIRPLKNKLDDRDPEKAKTKILKKGKVPDEHQDAIFTFRAADKLYEIYMEMGQKEAEEVRRMRTEYADRLTPQQKELLDQLEKDYAILQAEVPKAHAPLKAAYEDLTQGMTDPDYFIGRFKAESVVRYLEGFKEAAERREEKFRKFEEKNPRPKSLGVAQS